jgi:hypothetical protein
MFGMDRSPSSNALGKLGGLAFSLFVDILYPCEKFFVEQVARGGGIKRFLHIDGNAIIGKEKKKK